MNPTFPSKERIRDTLVQINKTFQEIADEAHVSRNTLMKIIDLKSYRFDTYEKIVAYCKTVKPDEDWSYPSLEELTYFYMKHRIPREEGTVPSLRSSFLSCGKTPKVNNYMLLCNIKAKMEANKNV